jgi:hypothetical protein
MNQIEQELQEARELEVLRGAARGINNLIKDNPGDTDNL